MKATVILALMLGVYSWAQQRDEAFADAMASADCRPADRDEIAIQTIVNGHVFCERHQRVSYGMADTALACPINGACGNETLALAR